MDGIYLDDATYNALVDKLMNNDLCAVTGRVEADQVKIALGEIGGIWPASIQDDDDSRLSPPVLSDQTAFF